MTEKPTYNPYEFRVKTEKSASNFEVVIHLIKASFGIGILSLPFAINRAGWLISAIVAFPLTVLLIYAIHVLIRTMYKICVIKEQPYISYEDCMKAVALDGPKGWKKCATFLKGSIRGLLIVYPLGTCIAYVIFIANALNQMLPLVENTAYSLYAYEAIVFLPLFIINCLPNLHKLAAISIIANILTLTTFAGLLYFFYGVGDFPEGDHIMVGTVLKIALFPGTVFFALESASVILSLEEHMAKPQYFLGWLGMFNIGMLTVITLYCLIGISGYIKYGVNTLPSINLNIPQDSSFALVMKYLFIICIYCSYPLQFYPVMVFIWEDHLVKKVKENKQKIYEILFKFGMTLSTVVAALIMPEFDLVVTLVGATCISTLGLIFPGLMEYLYYWSQNSGKVNGTMVKDIIIMIIGLVLFFSVIIAVIIEKIMIELKMEESRSRLYGL